MSGLAMSNRTSSDDNIPPLRNRRKELRNNGTAAEAVLWKHLQRRQLLGKKFRRQHSINRYIVDFFCVECAIAIELDGAPHFSELGEEYEAERTRFLEAEGIVILRFENRILYQNIEAVLETIREAVRKREADHPCRADNLR
jgi:very-short-patch-repair endonuclease